VFGIVSKKEEFKNVYGDLYGEKYDERERFFLKVFIINKRSIREFVNIILFTLILFSTYVLFRTDTPKLSMFWLGFFLFLGIVDLIFITRFFAHYIILPRIYKKAHEVVTASWADAIRFSRYPATMIVSVFSIFVFICWIIVASDLKNHLTRLPVVFMFAPLICAMVGYSVSALYTFKGTSPLFTDVQKRNASILSSAYWMVAEYFLIFSLVDVFIMTVYFFTYIVK